MPNSPANQFEIVSPIDGSTYASIPQAQDGEIDAALALAQRAQRHWASIPIAERAALCRAFVNNIVSRADQLGEELCWQIGRPIRYASGEITGGFQERALHMIDIAPHALADIRPAQIPGSERFIKKMPVGVVFLVAAWNYPYLTAVNALIPALMAGNSVILKHARQSLLVGERLAIAGREAGFPDGLLTHLVIDHRQSAKIVADPIIQQVNFTGSVQAGRTIQKAGAHRFINMGLELGGKDAAYVRADADLSYSVEQLVDGSFFNSGQSCCGIERIYVARTLFDEFVSRAVALTRTYILGDPRETSTTLGPVISKAAAHNISLDVEAACAQGAHAHLDRSDFPATDNPAETYLMPQILTSVDHSMRIMSEETFGPVVGIMPVDNDETAITLMNDSPYGLTGSIWTEDLDAAKNLGARLNVGTVFMNRCDYLDPALGWTGTGDTGRGVTLSALGYDHLTRPMSFNLRTDMNA